MPARILVIDDELLILNTIERALSKVGHTVFRAMNMEELSEALKAAPFDLLLTDLHMDEDSVENIIARVKQSSPSIRVLLMSGESKGIDPAHFIEKPFKIDELRERVGSCLDEPL